MAWYYVGSICIDKAGWCEICNGGEEIYHIIMNKHGEELHVCDNCLNMTDATTQESCS